MQTNRRQFLQDTSAALGAIGMAWLPRELIDPRLSADAILAKAGFVYDEARARALAARALEAARAAGAKLADVRINESRTMMLLLGDAFIADGSGISVTVVTPMVGVSSTIGVRALVDGTWGFAGGSDLTDRGVESLARLAVEFAREARRRKPRPFEYAPAPVVPDGRWETAIETDPFSIPIGVYLDRYREAMTAAKEIKGTMQGGQPSWYKMERLFASTEGSVIVQRQFISSPSAGSTAARPSNRLLFETESIDLPMGGYGYETIANFDLTGAWRRAAEEAKRLAALPFKNAEVGRYDIVFGSGAMAGVLVPTGRALELDRALGHKANADGTTFAMPPLDMVGKLKLGSTLVNISGDRSRPRAVGTIGWDEEGVKPEQFQLVRNGIVVDYITTRGTAPALAAWYSKQGKAVRSHGCAARTGGLQPILQLPNLTIEPGAEAVSQDDLIKQVKRGYYVHGGGANSDQQQMNMQMTAGRAYEIVSGKLGSRVVDMGIQFLLSRFWQNVAGIGGSKTSELHHVGVDLPEADRLFQVGAYTVPTLVRQLNVVNTGREA